MYKLVESWIDKLELSSVPEDVAAFCFNLYDGCDNEHWSMELVGTDSFDADDSDWACGEVTDFGSRAAELKWIQKGDWEAALAQMVSILNAYLDKGKYATVLKNKAAVAVGFTDGDLEILFTN
jgi:shikimate kinase